MDYSALAQQYGATSSAPPQATTDYSAIAQKFGAVSSTPSHPVADFARSVYSGIASPILNMIARPAQVVSHLIKPDQAQSGDLPIGFGSTAHITDPNEDVSTGADPNKTITSDIGRGAQTVALGLGPVAGGAAFGGGSALEQGKPLLPTLQGDGIFQKAKNLATDNALGNAVLGAAAGKVGDLAVRGIGSGISKVGSGLQVVGGGADALYNSAAKNISRVLAPTTKANKLATERLAPKAAREGFPVAFTRKALLDKLSTTADEAGTKIDTAWANLPPDAKLDVRPIVQSIYSAMDGLKIKGPKGDIIPSEQQPYFDQLAAKAQELAALADHTGQADAQAVRAYRQSLDGTIAQNKSASFSFSPADTAKMSGTKLTTNTTRGEIANQVPGIAEPNKQFNLYQGLADVLDATITRKTGQGTPLGEKIMEGAGAAGGFAQHGLSGGIEYALIAKFASKVLNSTAWETASASAKKSLADAISKGDSVAIANAIKSGFKLTGTGLEHVGNFIRGIPDAARSLPRQPIPGTATDVLKPAQAAAGLALPPSGWQASNWQNPLTPTSAPSSTKDPLSYVRTPAPTDTDVVAGVDITKWATDPHHEEKVTRIFNDVSKLASPASIDNYIKSKFPNSRISGQDIWKTAENAGISPHLLLAIVQQDSSLGTAGLGKKTNNPGNVGNDDAGHKRRFASMQEGLRAAAALLAKYKTSTNKVAVK
jgi:hypothetical protein